MCSNHVIFHTPHAHNPNHAYFVFHRQCCVDCFIMLSFSVSLSPQSHEPIPSWFSSMQPLLHKLTVTHAFRFSHSHGVFVALRPVVAPPFLVMASMGGLDYDAPGEEEQQPEADLARKAARQESEQMESLEFEPFANSGSASSSTANAPPAIVTSLSLSTTVESTPRDPTRKL